jgi:hypothetical protein
LFQWFLSGEKDREWPGSTGFAQDEQRIYRNGTLTGRTDDQRVHIEFLDELLTVYKQRANASHRINQSRTVDRT